MITIENVSFRHGKAPVLKDISLTIEKGGITALIGPNGAGKSTLFALMARLLPLQTGRITFDELDVRQSPSRELALKLAILRQITSIASRITVREMIGFGRFPHHRGRPGNHDREKVGEALEMFDLGDLSGRFIDELSGGQRQRVLVAMAYAQDTDYLLLDEPLNNLDMHYARDLMKQLRSLADTHGKTIVVVLHEINYAAAYADRIIALKDGTVAAQGKTADFMTEKTLSAIYNMEVRIRELDGKLIALHHA
ncbi:ATP-binding cassette domain-containing protein [Labrenzia sp. 011]|uniref:iron ABC transporter ATP-binding protein n=1 Tax=Labrenzia sp. 011 TaxID=2171494 RepID=UPI000D5198C7|nr:ATP-binding cassette domain-containing protein [Labrenzia sp. 011]PVB62399.1 iron ABC transporter ATP-binding protein [Labrenzia sp. 011]